MPELQIFVARNRSKRWIKLPVSSRQTRTKLCLCLAVIPSGRIASLFFSPGKGKNKEHCENIHSLIWENQLNSERERLDDSCHRDKRHYQVGFKCVVLEAARRCPKGIWQDGVLGGGGYDVWWLSLKTHVVIVAPLHVKVSPLNIRGSRRALWSGEISRTPRATVKVKGHLLAESKATCNLTSNFFREPQWEAWRSYMEAFI